MVKVVSKASKVVHVTAECPSTWQHCETSVQTSGHPPGIVGGDGGIGGGEGGIGGGGGAGGGGGGDGGSIGELWHVLSVLKLP